MSENNTAETNYSRSFEEKVFLRFDAIDARFNSIDARFNAVDERFNAVDARFDRVDARFDSLENRVEKLEMKQYDTKPIWEEALRKISETDTKVEQLRSDMKTEFATLRNELDDSFRGVEWKIEALNENMLKLQADQKYARRRLQDLESQTKPT